jgi:hypothetical protein
VVFSAETDTMDKKQKNRIYLKNICRKELYYNY